MQEINHEKIAEFQKAVSQLLRKFEEVLTTREMIFSVMKFASIYVFSVATAAEMPEKEAYKLFYDFQTDMSTCFKELRSHRDEVFKEFCND